jgi:hypothetical protein
VGRRGAVQLGVVEPVAVRVVRDELDADAAGGYNPNCKLWSHQGFNYSVDLYDSDARLAIEVEKSERKNISDDRLNFETGTAPGKTAGR